MKERYNPRNRNQNVTRARLSWSEAFDDHAVHRRPPAPCGFKPRDEKP